MIKVLIVGLGSIGQRHANALISIGIKNIAALRTRKGQKGIDNILASKVEMFDDEQEAFLWKPTHIIISNPTSLHLPYIQKAIDLKLNFFVEKPISNELNDVIKISENTLNINGLVGYNLRFHNLIQFVKNTIVSKKYGRVLMANLHVGQYLPNWHPYEDYREAYYAKKELGGGALRTLSHEVDLLQFFFGQVESVFSKVQKVSDLEIDVDDVTTIIAKTEMCQQVIVNINFLDPNIKRNGHIYFSEGVIHYDFIKSTVIFIDNSGKTTTIYSDQNNINDQYKAQMESFISNKAGYSCSFNDGVTVLKIIESCIQSNNEKKEICLI